MAPGARPESAPASLEPAITELLERLGNAPNLDLETSPMEEALALARPVMPVRPPPRETQDVTINAPGDAALRLRLYGASASDAADARRPVMLHLHGGGFVVGSIELDDERCVRLAQETACIVASLDYRLAPEFPFPTAIEDAWAAWIWLRDHASGFGGDANRLAVSGSSAGGHIAVGLSLLASERGVPLPLFQVLTYPVNDPLLGTPSYSAFTDGPFMTRARMAWYWKQYVPDAHREDALWNPMRADPLSLPPTLVLTAEYDLLRDEGEAFAGRRQAVGVPTHVRRYPGMVHGFISVLPKHPQADAALHELARFMIERFAGHVTEEQPSARKKELVR